MSACLDTGPIPIHGHPVTYRPGQLVTAVFDVGGWPRRFFGRVEEATHPATFLVRWHEAGVGRFVHGGEPPTMRAASQAEFQDHWKRSQRAVRAAELRHLVAQFPNWPTYVIDALQERTRELVAQ